MDDEHVPDRAWDRNARGENALQQLDRNWADLLQELRVTQTGVQLLTGFLLVLPFQPAFTRLADFQLDVYLVTVSASLLATVLLIGPVALHRVLFRRRMRAETVQVGHRLAMAGLSLLATALTGVAFLVFDVVSGRLVAWIAAVTILGLLVVVWAGLPWLLVLRNRPRP